ncbi:gamma carbonic anhydrase family protein [Burkholderia sp. BCC0405]|uniref:gamma carbonic anhydrase family protein n=1 Tax=Burkholderia sp. BCC0405 TaxID=2676298 RepID=UPI00158AB696|nr:gamma carbonic anhydrase family protein [Burkholderia sp. BCC0405]
MKLFAFQGLRPRIHPDAYVFEDAVIIGDVEIGPGVSIWPGVTIRGDKARILIGAGSNIQEHAMLHADPGYPLTLGENVTIGHGVMLHGCDVGSHSVIGIGAILLNGSKVGSCSLVTAGSQLGAGPPFADNSLISGNPARVLMTLGVSDIGGLRDTAREYQDLAEAYRRDLHPLRPDEIRLESRRAGGVR